MKKFALALLVLGCGSVIIAQQDDRPGFGPGGGPPGAGPGGFGQRGFGPGQGPPGGGGPNQEEREILAEFDSDENGWLNQAERAVARKKLEADSPEPGGFGGGPPGGRGGGPPGRGAAAEGKPGRLVKTDMVESYPDAEMYDTSVMRTIFLQFENEDWEKELETFHNTDVEVPAMLTVDGKSYEHVGVHFRGMSSYHHVQTGSKRSLNISMDLVDEDQRLYGTKTLNLLNCNGDPSLMSSVLYSHIARQYLPAPKANFVHVVINGRSWGVYDNVQQFDKLFLKENYGASKGTRWKVSGNPSADGGLRYLGDELEPYQERFEMKSNDGEKAWRALIELCRVLNETPPEELEAALEPILDVDEALRFLAVDVALVNSDGYWTRASDYSIFRDGDGKFHLLPHDMNEAFALAGPGGGGPGRGGPDGPGGGRGGPGGRGFGFEPGPGGPGAGRPNEGRPNEGRPGEGRPGEGGLADGEPGEGRPARGGRGRGERDTGERGPDERGPGEPGAGPIPDFGQWFGGRGGRPGGGGPGRGGPGGGGPGGGGPGGGPGGHGSVDLDPLVGLDSDRMPLRSRLLAVPALKERYLKYVNEIASKSLDWDQLGPVAESFRDLIGEEVKLDTRKVTTYDAFVAATNTGEDATDESSPMSLKKFALERSRFLTEVKETEKQTEKE